MAVEAAALIMLVLFLHAALTTLRGVVEAGVEAEQRGDVLELRISVENGGLVDVDVGASVDIRGDGQVLSSANASVGVPRGESRVLSLEVPIPKGVTEERARLDLRLSVAAFRGLLRVEISGTLGGGGE